MGPAQLYTQCVYNLLVMTKEKGVKSDPGSLLLRTPGRRVRDDRDCLLFARRLPLIDRLNHRFGIFVLLRYRQRLFDKSPSVRFVVPKH